MREIIFRGKRVFNGEWVQGCYVFQDKLHEIEVNKTITGECFDRYSVIPETVGQFTGLYAKNGKRIFEGDIVRHFNRIGVGEPEFFEVGEIRWNARECVFERTFDCGINFGAVRINDECVYEVIGNIHDNPELLEEV